MKKKLKFPKELYKGTKELKLELQKAVNRFIRARDSKMIQGTRIGECISCGKLVQASSNEWQAGHYYSVGAYPNLRYDELNIHGQCSRCNLFKEGHKQGYRDGLIKRYGANVISTIEMKKGNKLKLVVADYNLLIKYYNQQTEQLLKAQIEERRKFYGG